MFESRVVLRKENYAGNKFQVAVFTDLRPNFLEPWFLSVKSYTATPAYFISLFENQKGECM